MVRTCLVLSDFQDRDDRRPLIWVVEDSPTQAAMTERLLGEQFRYERFVDGTAAIERISGGGPVPDLVLLDWVMPGLSGDEVCRCLRRIEQTRELPIIILTASRTATEDIVCALESGANDYVAKPFVAAELHARVGSILRVQRERRRVAAMNSLAAALLHADGSEAVLAVMTRWLGAAFAGDCVASLVQEGVSTRFAGAVGPGPGFDTLASLATSLDPGTHDMATLGEPRIAAVVVKTIPIRGIATGSVAVARPRGAAALDARDHVMFDTCLEYSAIAIEAALRGERDRATKRFHEEMVGIVGHDLKGPLSAFSLGLELLREESGTAGTTETLARLSRSNVRMTKIVEQLLDVTRSRIGTGIPVQRDWVSLRESVVGVLDEVRISHKETSFELIGEDVRGYWDRDRLEQVVSNLAKNAAQHGRPNAVVRTELSIVGDEACLRIHNENRGEPIAPELLATIFDPFKRGRANGNIAGLGLGLYIVHQIVLAHRGVISVISDDTGTTFRVMLPLHHGDVRFA